MYANAEQGLFVGAYYWYQYLQGNDVAVDGVTFSQLGTKVDLGRRRPADEETLGGTSTPSQEGEKKE